MLILSWVLLVASVALSTLLQVAVAPRSLVGYLTAGAGALTKRALAERAYTTLAVDSQRVSAVQLAEAAALSPSYARALAAEFASRPPAAAQRNGQPSNRPARGGGR